MTTSAHSATPRPPRCHFAHAMGSALFIAGVILCLAGAAHAQFRSPQVTIGGDHLQTLLDSFGQTIDVTTEQRAAQTFYPISVGTPGSVTFNVRAVRESISGLSLYDTGGPSPVLRLVGPSPVTPGWFANVSFRTSPDRLVVNLFDATSSLVGSTVYVGVNLLEQGFAIMDLGAEYSEDARNVGQQPRMLFFRGTGAFAGDVWLCIEIDGDQDFDDAVYRLEYFAPTPARRDTWARVKQRYR